MNRPASIFLPQTVGRNQIQYYNGWQSSTTDEQVENEIRELISPGFLKT